MENKNVGRAGVSRAVLKRSWLYLSTGLSCLSCMVELLFSSHPAAGESLHLLLLSDTGGMVGLNSPDFQGWQLGSIYSL